MKRHKRGDNRRPSCAFVIKILGGVSLNKNNLLYLLKAPCGKCPYKLGLVRTIVNPCPQCKADNYRTYERFTACGMTTNKPDEA